MVLSRDGIALVLQPDMEFMEEPQEDILSGLTILAWKCKASFAKYMRVTLVLAKEEDKVELLEAQLQLVLAVERNPVPFYQLVSLILSWCK